MNKSITLEQLQWQAVLSGLWVYFLLNILFRDLHELFRAGFLEQALAGMVNGVMVTEINLLYGGIALQIPLLGTVLSRLLNQLICRRMNLIASTCMFVAIVAFNTNPDMDDLLFAFMELLALLAIFGFAWRGPRQAQPALFPLLAARQQ